MMSLAFASLCTVKRMKFAEAVALLKLLGTKHEDAMTAQAVVSKWNKTYNEELHLRTAQRYLSELSTDGVDQRAVLEVDTSNQERRYHLRLSEMANWLMTDEAALLQVLSLQVLQSTFGCEVVEGVERQMDVAQHLVQEHKRTKRLRERVRIVPDGIGRLRARIDPQILASVMDALAGDQLLSMQYKSLSGNVSSKEVSPLGLVAKDGTLYVLAVTGFGDKPIHYAMHRFISGHVSPRRAQSREDFDLDRYINDSHQLSHPLGPTQENLMIKLKVKRTALFHFLERPLSAQQVIKPSGGQGSWAIVTAPIPLTVLLKPFLASLGPDVEILEPSSLRQDMAQWFSSAAQYYGK